MTAIPFPLSTSPGLRPQDGAGRLINCFAEPRGEDQGAVWRRAPGAVIFGTDDRGTFSIAGTTTVLFVGQAV